ncbi:G-protein alpha-subunit, partial [Mycena rebaudengoi]
FCTALSDYDEVLVEDRSANRMHESLALFASVINSRWFLRTSLILFLNQINVFKQNLPKVRFCPIICSALPIPASHLLRRPSRCSLSTHTFLAAAPSFFHVNYIHHLFAAHCRTDPIKRMR